MRAIKSIKKRKGLAGDRQLLKFEREVENLKQLDHPNIIRIFEVFEDNRDFHIVTELWTHGELFDYVNESHKLSEKIAATVMG